MLETRQSFRFKLSHRQLKKLDVADCTTAAVSLVFRFNSSKVLELLFMQRAYNDADPWSGQICFPGGRFEQSDLSMKTTAERETQEEMGFQLQPKDYIGQLDDTLGPIVGDKKTVHVSSFVYLLEKTPKIDSNYEVENVIWVPLTDLVAPNRRVHFDHPSVANVTMQGVRFDTLSRDGEPLVLWGLSFYLMQHAITALELESR